MTEKTKKHKNRIWLWILLPVLLLAGAATGFYFFYRVEMKVQETVYELGENVVTDPFYYLSGTDFAVERSSVDMTGVCEGMVGTYEVKITHGWQELVSMVRVEDTTAPSVKVREGSIYLQRDEIYYTKDFVLSASDLSGEVRLSLAGEEGSKGQDSISYDTCGSQTFFVLAEDAYGNITRVPVTVVVDTPPEFGYLEPYHIAAGSEEDYMAQVYAYDEVDGDVTGSIQMDLSGLNTEKAGEYQVQYLVTDAYGLSVSAQRTVWVYDPLDLQDKINRHELNRLEDHITGAPNLYDSGYYEGQSLEKTLELIEPCFVRIRKDYKGGKYIYGSGYIVKITDEDIILCTNDHVVEDNKTMDVYFHDGTKVVGTVIGSMSKKLGEDDIAFIKVSRAKIKDSLMDTLKTIHIDKAYWDQLPDRPEGILVGYVALDEKGEWWKNESGSLLCKAELTLYSQEYGYLSEVKATFYHGTSGSALVDANGRLLAMVDMQYYYYDSVFDKEPTYSYWAVNLEHILNAYTAIVGGELNYR